MKAMSAICRGLNKILSAICFLALLFACNHVERGNKRMVELSLGRVHFVDGVSIRKIVFADDSLIVGDAISSEYELVAIPHDSPSYGVLRNGRGPMEVLAARVKTRSDTIHALSFTPYGISGAVKIPIHYLEDESRWVKVDYGQLNGLRIGADFDFWGQSDYVFPGARYGDENMLTRIGVTSPCEIPLNYWPADDYSGPPEPKLSMYLQSSVFCNGEKLLVATKEGRYASILDMSSGEVTETVLYPEFPKYHADSDGLNWRRSPGCALGCRAFATDSLIFLSHCTAMLEDHHFIPDNFKGYPPEYVDEIDVFDWEGNYHQTLHSSIPFLNYYVKGKTLYLLSEDLETSFSVVYSCQL